MTQAQGKPMNTPLELGLQTFVILPYVPEF